MKYLLVLAVVLVAFWVWRNNRLTGGDPHQPPANRKPPAPRPPVTMVACRHCGTHLPENETVHGRLGVYCSTEHRHLGEGAAP